MGQQDQVFHIPEPPMPKQRERILVFGVGGGGGNALNHIIDSGLEGVEYVAANTDSRALGVNRSPNKIILGEKLTKGLGAGANPQVGMEAARESIDRIRDFINAADMVFVTAGMGGGTGTGAAPIIAEIAKENGSLVVAVVTSPFSFEGRTRISVAKDGIVRLKDKVDALLVVENDRLLNVVNEKTKSTDAYKMANEVLRQAVQGVTDLILKPGLINVDFADIRTVMQQSGSAIMGIGTGEGDNRAELAAKSAIKSPLMSMPISGAKGILINIAGTSELTLFEISKAADIINAAAVEDAQIIFGHTIDEDMGGVVKVTVIATGFNGMEGGDSGGKLPKGGPSVWTKGTGRIPLPAQDGSPEDLFQDMPNRTGYDTPTIFRLKGGKK
ncbi:MAG: cell division protein FtsZ [Synergistaceae bacterium]|jgi:cell division protein FtsZ|nr:cell division protein FtsZ [Synergistaceae bacterium]